MGDTPLRDLMSGFLERILLPPTSLVLLVLLGFVLARIRGDGWMGLSYGAFALLFLLSTPLVSGALLCTLQPFAPLDTDALGASGAEAIVVLSAGDRLAEEFDAPAPDGLSLQRLRYAAFLERKTHLPILISGGGQTLHRERLADVLANSMRADFGLDVRWREGRSRDTWENGSYSAAMLKSAGVRRVFLVSHAWHLPRAKLAFEKNGIDVIPAPTSFVRNNLKHIGNVSDVLEAITPNVESFQNSYYFFHEFIGYCVYSFAR